MATPTPNHHRKLLEYPTNFPICPIQCNPHLNPTSLCSLDCTHICPIFCHPIYYYSPTPSPTTTPYPTLTPPNHHHKPPFSLPLKISLVFLIATFIYTLYKFYTIWCRSRPHVSPQLQPVWENNETNGVVEVEVEVEVDHPIWYIRTTGLQQSVINGLTLVKYSKVDGLTVEGSVCSVCLTEFEEGDMLRLLPYCKHAFHVKCIDTWLRSHINCPLCRAVIVNDNDNDNNRNAVDATSFEGDGGGGLGVVDNNINNNNVGDQGEASGSSGMRIGENYEEDGNDNCVK